MDTSQLTVTVEFSHTEDRPEWPSMAIVMIPTENPVELHRLMKETSGGDFLAVIHKSRSIPRRAVTMNYDFKTMGSSYCMPALERFLETCDKLGIKQRWSNYNPRTYYTDIDHARQNIK